MSSTENAQTRGAGEVGERYQSECEEGADGESPSVLYLGAGAREDGSMGGARGRWSRRRKAGKRPLLDAHLRLRSKRRTELVVRYVGLLPVHRAPRTWGRREGAAHAALEQIGLSLRSLARGVRMVVVLFCSSCCESRFSEGGRACQSLPDSRGGGVEPAFLPSPRARRGVRRLSIQSPPAVKLADEETRIRRGMSRKGTAGIVLPPTGGGEGGTRLLFSLEVACPSGGVTSGSQRRRRSGSRALTTVGSPSLRSE